MKQNIVTNFQEACLIPQQPEIVAYEINTLLRQAVLQLSYIAAERNIRLSLTTPEEYTIVWCDVRLATSLIPKFLIGSLLGIQEGSEVEIRATVMPEHWNLAFGETEITFPIPSPVMSPETEIDTEDFPVKDKKRDYRVFVLAEDAAYGSFLKEWLEHAYNVSFFADKESMCKEWRTGLYPDLLLLEGRSTDKCLEEFCQELKADVQTNPIRLIRLTDCIGNRSSVSSMADLCMERPCNLDHLKAEMDRQLLLGEYTDRAYYKLLQNRDVLPRRCRSKKDEEDTLFMRKLCRLIRENISEPHLTVDGLSKEMGLCRSSLYTRVKGITDLPPRELIANERIRAAKSLLEEGTHLVGEVGLMVGINDLKYFGDVFKKAVGITPSEYMRNYKDK